MTETQPIQSWVGMKTWVVKVTLKTGSSWVGTLRLVSERGRFVQVFDTFSDKEPEKVLKQRRFYFDRIESIAPVVTEAVESHDLQNSETSV